jgi:hypothetical protein
VIEVDDLNQRSAPSVVDGLRRWRGRHVLVAVVAGVLVALAIGLPTDVIANPIFGRPVPVTWWSYPTLAVTAMLGGLLAATYVSDWAGAPPSLDDMDTPTRRGGVAGLLTFFAVGCPVCNKLVVVAIGTTGARQWFEPVQPLLAVGSIVLLAWALRARLRSTMNCSI